MIHQIDIEALKGHFAGFHPRTSTINDIEAELPAPITGGGTLLESLVGILTWGDRDNFLQLLQQWYLQCVYLKIRQALTEIRRKDAAAEDWLRASLDRLPDWAVNRFLAAPETGRHISKLRYNTAEHIAFFRAALMAEQKLNGSPVIAQPCWSALGDFYFCADAIVDPCHEQWNSELSLAAPRVGHLLPVDFCSPYAQTINSMPECPFEPYTPSEAAKLCASLDTALQAVESISPAAARLIHGFVHVIVPRKDPLHPQAGFASSTPSHIGRLLVRNGHLMSLGSLTDSLVHEGIHAILFVLELSEPFISSPAAAQVFVRSPWSGNSIPISAYLHACFVWYGLARFWRTALESKTLPGDIVRRHLATAVNGFKRANPTGELQPHANLIRRNTLEVGSTLHHELEVEGFLNWEA